MTSPRSTLPNHIECSTEGFNGVRVAFTFTFIFKPSSALKIEFDLSHKSIAACMESCETGDISPSAMLDAQRVKTSKSVSIL